MSNEVKLGYILAARAYHSSGRGHCRRCRMGALREVSLPSEPDLNKAAAAPLSVSAAPYKSDEACGRFGIV